MKQTTSSQKGGELGPGWKKVKGSSRHTHTHTHKTHRHRQQGGDSRREGGVGGQWAKGRDGDLKRL